jgi:hypothetical protein
MNKKELLAMSGQLLESLQKLPLPGDDGYSKEWNEGYRVATLAVVSEILNKVEKIEG